MTSKLLAQAVASGTLSGNSTDVSLASNGAIQLAANNGTDIFIAANNNVGIGNTTPADALSVLGNTYISSTLTVGSATVNTTNYSGTANNASYLGGTAAASYLLSSTAASTYLPLSGGTLTGATTISTATDQTLNLNSTDSNWNYIGFSWAGTRKSYFGVSSSGNPTWGTDSGSFSIEGNYTTLSNSTRSPLFYDSDDTGFYVDPNSVTTVNVLQRSNSRVNTSAKYPVGRYETDGTVFAIDPTWSQSELQAYFNSTGVTWVADSTAPGGYCISVTGSINVGGVYSSGFPFIPIGTNDIFYMEIWIKDVSGTNAHYMGSIDYDQNFSSLGGNPGSYGYWCMSGSYPGTSWKKYSGYVSGFATYGTPAGTFVTGSKYWTPQALFNYAGGGTSYISGWKAVRVSHPGATAVDSLRLNNVTVLSKAAYNNFLMLHNNTVYTTTGQSGTYSAVALGRGASYPTHYGFDGLRAVTFPAESGSFGSYIIDAGTNGYQLSYALFSNGNLYTWGLNSVGQCGVGSTSQIYVPTLAATNVTNVYIHPNNARDVTYTKLIIKKTDGYLYATGYNGYGQLGVGDTSNRSSFTQITSLGNSILNVWNMGATYGCLVVQKTDYTIWVAGYNGYGQLGNGNTTTQSTPINVTTAWGGGTGYTLMKVIGGFGYYSSAENSISCMGMLLDNGTTTVFRMAGYNGDGELGNGNTTNQSTPVTPNVGAGRITDVAGFGGGVMTTYCLKADNTLYTWGYNSYGQVGDGTSTARSVPYAALTNVRQLFCDGLDNHIQGYVTNGFVRRDDGLYTTGYNGYGQCGVGDSTQRSSFTKVLLPQNFVVKQMGWYPTSYPVMSYIALSTDGRLYAWGYNGSYGITPDTGNNIYTPVQINLPLGG